MKRYVIYLMMVLVLILADIADVSAQLYRRENRRGNRAFAAQAYDKALEHYKNSLQKDTVNMLPLAYNMAYVLHSDRRDSTRNAANDTLALEYLDKIAESVAGTEHEFAYHFTRGVIDIDMEDWESAVDEFKKCLLMDPEDMKARENYIYAKEHLKREQQQQQQQQQQQSDQNQDKQDQNGDQNQQQSDQNQDQNQDQQDQQNQQGQQDQGDQQNQDQDQNDEGQDGQGQPQQSKISPQAAQQILQAMQAKERETQDKVEKKKAAAMRSKQKEKNW